MNSRKLLQSLLVCLGVFTLTISGCKNDDNTDSNSGSHGSSSTSETTSESDSNSVSDSVTDTDSDSDSVTDTDSDSVTDTDSDTGTPVPESTEFAVEFNYADKGFTVWTDYAVNQTEAPAPEGLSEKPDYLEGRHTIGTFGEKGYYTFAVDSNGYVVYATYGIGGGWGGPGDGYYHNQPVKDNTDTDYFVLHDEWAPWPGTTSDGRNAWTLYDFVVPTGGFVITAWHDNPEFVAMWKVLFGEAASPVVANIDNAGNNQFLEFTTPSGSLNKYYLKLDENRELSVRERLPEEIANADGEQEFPTPSKDFETTDLDNPVVYDAIADAKAYTDQTKVYNIKGVITSFYQNGAVVVQDENGEGVVVFSYDLIGDMEEAKFAVGETISAKGTMATFNGLIELEPTEVKKVEKYGKLPVATPTLVNAENVATEIVVANQSKYVKLVGAKVESIDSEGSSVVKVGETQVTLFKTTFPETVKVGDTIDVTGIVSVFKDSAQLRVDSADMISRYYNVTVDSGNGSPVTTAHSTGDTVTLTATPLENHVFQKWVKVTKDEEGAEVLVDVSTDATTTVTVEQEDVTYRAICVFAPWTTLEPGYERVASIDVLNTSADSSFTVWNDESGFIGHNPEGWKGGTNTIDASWRTIFVVDSEGRVTYGVWCPANGYGGANGSSYFSNSFYDDVETNPNPAFEILEGFGPWEPGGTAHNQWNLVVPEGGFAITSYDAQANAMVAALTNNEITTASADFNKRLPQHDSARVYYDAAAGKVHVYYYTLPETSTVLKDNDDVVRYAAGTEVFDGTDWANGVWANYMIVDADGVIAYNVWNVGCGYGKPTEGSFYANEKYATENPCITEDGKIVVPEGFTGFKFGYGEYLNTLYGALSFDHVTHDILNADGYAPICKNWNSLENKYIAQDAIIEVGSNYLIVNPGTAPVIEEEKYTVLDGTAEEVTLGEYTIAVDSTGKIIFASRTSSGYGGPGDGFYHDGTYVATAGQVCGIFNLDPEWAKWPATTPEGENAWTLYTVVVPEGGYIITGSANSMLELIKEVTGNAELTIDNLTGNGLFEATVADGDLNDVVVTVVDGVVTVTRTPSTEA